MNDVIERQAALDCFHDWIDKHGNVYCADESEEYQRIEALPSVQPMRKKGKWTKEYSYNNEWGDTVERLRCSICESEHSYCCGSTAHDDDGWFDFCPYCGADMERRPQ